MVTATGWGEDDVSETVARWVQARVGSPGRAGRTIARAIQLALVAAIALGIWGAADGRSGAVPQLDHVGITDVRRSTEPR